MALGMGEDVDIWRRRFWIALCGGTVLEKALDRTMWRNGFGGGFGSRYVEKPFWRRLWIVPCRGTVLEKALDRAMWRNHFGGGFGPVVRQNTVNE
jgi:hypothetical protein